MLESEDLILAKAKLEDLNAIYKNFLSQKDTAQYMLWKRSKHVVLSTLTQKIVSGSGIIKNT